MNLLITGKSGRMGQALLEAATQAQATVAATHDLGQDLDAAFQKADTAIDFTVHSFTPQVIAAALKHNTRLVIGTTGHTDEERQLIHDAAKSLPIGTAYAIWTGIGAVGTALIGIFVFGEPRTAARLVCIVLIVAGIVGLKLASSSQA